MGRSLGVVLGFLGFALGLWLLSAITPVPEVLEAVGFLWALSVAACVYTVARSSGLLRLFAIVLAGLIVAFIVVLAVTARSSPFRDGGPLGRQSAISARFCAAMRVLRAVCLFVHWVCE